MKKQYVIESEGFTKGIGSSEWRKKRLELLKEIKHELKQK